MSLSQVSTYYETQPYNPKPGDIWPFRDGHILVCPFCEEWLAIHHKVILYDGKPTLVPSVVHPGCSHFFITEGKVLLS